MARLQALLPGVALTAALAAGGFGLNALPGLGVVSPLIAAIVLGIALRNLAGTPAWARPGIVFSLRRVLRAAIVLLGFQLTLGEVWAIGPTGLALVTACLGLTFVFAFVIVFLVLVAQFESLTSPLVVILTAPFALAAAAVALMLSGVTLNIYSQIGLVMLIGLAAKNAILIVEFAKLQVEEGKPLVEAALEGARLRLRPILMTSFAFILGCVPLAIASGAGAVSRQQLGIAVITGMLAATALGIFLVPVLFVVIERLTAGRRAQPSAVGATSVPVAGGRE